jgi:hypothetical protein
MTPPRHVLAAQHSRNCHPRREPKHAALWPTLHVSCRSVLCCSRDAIHRTCHHRFLHMLLFWQNIKPTTKRTMATYELVPASPEMRERFHQYTSIAGCFAPMVSAHPSEHFNREHVSTCGRWSCWFICQLVHSSVQCKCMRVPQLHLWLTVHTARSVRDGRTARTQRAGVARAACCLCRCRAGLQARV